MFFLFFWHSTLFLPRNISFPSRQFSFLGLNRSRFLLCSDLFLLLNQSFLLFGIQLHFYPPRSILPLSRVLRFRAFLLALRNARVLAPSSSYFFFLVLVLEPVRMCQGKLGAAGPPAGRRRSWGVDGHVPSCLANNIHIDEILGAADETATSQDRWNL